MQGYSCNICKKYVKIIAEMKKNNTTRIKAGNTLTEAVPITIQQQRSSKRTQANKANGIARYLRDAVHCLNDNIQKLFSDSQRVNALNIIWNPRQVLFAILLRTIPILTTIKNLIKCLVLSYIVRIFDPTSWACDYCNQDIVARFLESRFGDRFLNRTFDGYNWQTCQS